jgi:Family of unknown function (DUF6056)
MGNYLERLITPLSCAALLTLANAFKPLVIDDSAYVLLARQIADDPLHPYGPPPGGFLLIWYQEPQGAFTLLAPPVLPYWLALEWRLFGDEPVLWKLGLFPFCWLLTAGLFALLKRFAAGWERPLLLLTVVSPTFLPGLNLMLDLPAAALMLAAVALFLRALERPASSWAIVMLAGALAALGMQTKYTGVTAPAVMLWYAILRRRIGAGLFACAIAAALFVAWELFIAHTYGQSHFLFHAARRYGPLAPGTAGNDLLPPVPEPYPWALRWQDKLRLVAPFFGYLGGLAAVLALLAWFALRVPRSWIYAGAGFVVLGFLALALVPNDWAVFQRSAQGEERLSVNGIVVGVNGVSLLVAALAVSCYLGFRGWGTFSPRLRRSADTWFLIGWFAIELAGYFVLSPFGAARRMLGLVVVITLLSGFLLRRTRRLDRDRTMVWRLTILGVFLGALFGVVDFADAWVEKRAAADSAAWIAKQPESEHAVWYCGHWGFQFYAERAGMQPVFPGRSMLRAGDWLVVPDPALRPHAQLIRLEERQVEPVMTAEWFVPIPLRTISEYYAGATPIRRHEGARMRVTIYRVRIPFLARSPD